MFLADGGLARYKLPHKLMVLDQLLPCSGKDQQEEPVSGAGP